jgi:hypothetical protein
LSSKTHTSFASFAAGRCGFCIPNRALLAFDRRSLLVAFGGWFPVSIGFVWLEIGVLEVVSYSGFWIVA